MTQALATTTQFPVKPGPPVLILAQMPPGTLIVNQDANNGVWISDQPNVKPSQGFFLGVGGVLRWQKQGSAYAIVDTGVTSAVTLTIGNSADSLTNPETVGVAVATQLLATGVPNVLTRTPVALNVSIPHNSAVPVSPWDIHGYSSIIVEIVTDPGTVGPRALMLLMQDSVGNVTEYYVGTSVPTSLLSGRFQDFIVPIDGYSNLSIQYLDANAGTTKVNIYGSNRPARSGMQSVPVHGDIETYYSGLTAFAVNTPVALNNVATPGDMLLQQNGWCQVEFVLASTAMTGEFFVQAPDFTNVVRMLRLADSTEMHSIGGNLRVYKQIILPSGNCGLFFNPRTANASTEAFVNITMLES